jgi:hypothetical protein
MKKGFLGGGAKKKKASAPPGNVDPSPAQQADATADPEHHAAGAGGSVRKGIGGALGGAAGVPAPAQGGPENDPRLDDDAESDHADPEFPSWPFPGKPVNDESIAEYLAMLQDGSLPQEIREERSELNASDDADSLRLQRMREEVSNCACRTRVRRRFQYAETVAGDHAC